MRGWLVWLQAAGAVLSVFLLFGVTYEIDAPTGIVQSLSKEANKHQAECDAEENAKNADIQKECRSFLYRLVIDPVAAFTGLLFVATVGLFVATGMLYAAAIRQSGDAKAALSQAKDAFSKTERAFVFVRDVRALTHYDTARGKIWWTFDVVWENSGNTPTKELYVHAYRHLSADRMPPDFGFKGHSYRTIRSMIGPKGSITSDPIIVDGDELAAVQRGQLHFYVWGFAEYRDIVTDESPHLTRFCYKVLLLGDPTRPVTEDNVVEFRYVHHPRFNCADEGCAEQDRTQTHQTI